MDKSKAPVYLFACLLANASGLGLIAFILQNKGVPADLRQTIAIVSSLTYLVSASLIYLHLKDRKSKGEDAARATLLAALPEFKPEQLEWKEKTLLEISETAVRELENLRQGQNAIVNFSGEIICSLDERLRIRELNLGAERIWRHPNISVLGAEFLSLVYEPDREKTGKNFMESQNNEGTEKPYECRMTDLNGRLIDMAWTIEWSPSKRVYFCIGTDISKEKEIEHLKAEITSMVSHDLRAPISSLAFFIQGLISGEFGQLSESGRCRIIAIRESIDQILRLINQLLDADRLESNSLELELKIIPASALIETSLSMLSNLAEKKKQQIKTAESEELVFADFDRSVQVLNNLLSNAIKYSPESREIEIKVNNEDNKVRFEIIDQGPGIPVTKWASIFERFKTLENEEKGASSGLGLYISKKLVELQGGSIGVYSVPGKGSRFYFFLKRACENDLPGYLD